MQVTLQQRFAKVETTIQSAGEPALTESESRQESITLDGQPSSQIPFGHAQLVIRPSPAVQKLLLL